MINDWEVWWLLSYPLIFALGWICARIDIKHLLNHVTIFPQLIYQGIEKIIQGQHQEGLAFLEEASQKIPQNNELQMLLGILFRRQGIVHKAIDTHRNLLFVLKSQEEALRSKTLYELAQDFLCGGIHNEAEKLLLELINTPQLHHHAQAALLSLLHLYQRQKNWHNAVLVLEHHLHHLKTEEISVILSHCYCECAQEHYNRQEYQKSDNYLQKCLKLRPLCIRAQILYIRFYGDQVTPPILGYCANIEKNHIEYIPHALHDIHKVYQTIYSNEVIIRYWESIYNKTRHVLILEELLRLYKALLTAEVAQNKIHRLINNSCSTEEHLILFHALNQYRDDSKDLSQVYLLYQQYQAEKSKKNNYLCEKCGFRTNNYSWLCPMCEAWESINPIQLS